MSMKLKKSKRYMLLATNKLARASAVIKRGESCRKPAFVCAHIVPANRDKSNSKAQKQSAQFN